jgi:hypothetical protein
MYTNGTRFINNNHTYIWKNEWSHDQGKKGILEGEKHFWKKKNT